jgi:Protein of unknown function (DUF3618)
MRMDQSTDRLKATRPDSYDRDKTPNEMEEDIARTRVRLSATIEALERELTPNRMLERSTELLRSSLEPVPGPFRDQSWAYAVPLALIATGLGWLFMLRRRSYQPETPASFGELPGEATETGETPPPAPLYADVAAPAEPVPLVHEPTNA